MRNGLHPELPLVFHGEGQICASDPPPASSTLELQSLSSYQTITVSIIHSSQMTLSSWQFKRNNRLCCFGHQSVSISLQYLLLSTPLSPGPFYPRPGAQWAAHGLTIFPHPTSLHYLLEVDVSLPSHLCAPHCFQKVNSLHGTTF